MAQTNQKSKGNVPLGKPLKFSDEQLDALAQVTPGDIAKAQALWRNSAPAEFKTLLDAEQTEQTPPRKKGTK